MSPIKLSRRHIIEALTTLAATQFAACDSKKEKEKEDNPFPHEAGTTQPDASPPDSGTSTPMMRKTLDGKLSLLHGYEAKLLQSQGQLMTDGYRMPGRPDGMGCFELADGNWSLLRNHELSRAHGAPYWGADVPAPLTAAFDNTATGGASRLHIDPSDLSIIKSELVLAGTLSNCSGGSSPWGWLSCEETREADHGYVFLCPHEPGTLADGIPLKDLGRFRHEALAFDESTSTSYLTEDEGDGLFYRCEATDPSAPFVGALEAMIPLSPVDPALLLTGNWAVGQKLRVRWQTIPDPDAQSQNCRLQLTSALRFNRGEGCIWAEDRVYFTCTAGGAAKQGQIFEYIPDRTLKNEGVLRAIYVSTPELSENNPSLIFPDNFCVSATGVMIICEDREEGSRLLIFRPKSGQVQILAVNQAFGSEFAGACFSPDNSTLFVNLQHEGLTIAISGPFSSLS